MSHHHHEYGQLRGWPHEFTRADYGDTVEPPDETVEARRMRKKGMSSERRTARPQISPEVCKTAPCQRRMAGIGLVTASPG